MTVRARAVVVALAAVLALGGCSVAAPTGDGRTDSGAPTGDISEDGSTRTWTPAERGEPVALSGVDFAGTPVDTASWRGDVVVVNTWYASCPACRVEAPDLVALSTDYADKGVRLLGINATDEVGAAQAFARTFEVPYPSLADTDREALAELEGVVPAQAVPTTVVLDRAGRVAARVLGLADAAALRTLVDDVLAEPAPTSDGA